MEFDDYTPEELEDAAKTKKQLRESITSLCDALREAAEQIDTTEEIADILIGDFSDWGPLGYAKVFQKLQVLRDITSPFFKYMLQRQLVAIEKALKEVDDEF